MDQSLRPARPPENAFERGGGWLHVALLAVALWLATTAAAQSPGLRGDLGDPAARLPPPVVLTDTLQPGDSVLEEGTVTAAPESEFEGWVWDEWPEIRAGESADDRMALRDEEEESNGRPSPSFNFTMQTQADFAWFHQSPENRAVVGNIPDGAFFRRARMGAFGEMYETFEYRIEFDFAGDARPRFLDLWIAATEIPLIRNVIVGHYFEPFSLERYSPNRFITFMERSLADTFVPARNMGAMTYGNLLDERATWALGMFRSESDDFGDDVAFHSAWAVTGHATILPWYREEEDGRRYLLHLGASASHREAGEDRVRFSSLPEVRMRQQGVGGVPVFVDTGDIDAHSHQLGGVEAALVHGPWSLQGELIGTRVDRIGGANPRFGAGYVFASWFLTGESRSYSPTSILGRFREGIFQRVEPRANVFDRSTGGIWTGVGAWELAVRYSFIDLDDQDIRGGYLQDITTGLNWYLNPHTRISLNHVHAILDAPVAGRSTADSIAMRFGFEY